MRADARWALLFVGYFATQFLLRLVTGPALELDEAEVFYHARELRWGYGPQPPLYFWLQWGAFQVLGETLAALAALKAVLLAGIVLGLYALLRREHPPAAAGTAALCLSLLPQVAWESQRALANSVLALLAAVAIAWAFALALERGRWRDHATLGALAGLGALAKYNVAVWPLGLLLGAVALPEWRGRLRPLRLLLAAAVAVAVVVPAGFWMLDNLGLATGSVRKFELDSTAGLAARLRGTGELGLAALSFSGLAALVLGGFAWGARRRRRGGEGLAPLARLLAAGAAASLAVVWVGVLGSGATSIKERWLLPFLWPVAPTGALLLWPRLSERARRSLAGAAAAAWLVAALALPYANFVDPGYRGADFSPLVERLRGLGAPARAVLVEDQWVAGNLAFAAPDLGARLARPGEPAPPGPFIAVLGPEGTGGPPTGRDVSGPIMVPVERGMTSEAVTIVLVDGRR